MLNKFSTLVMSFIIIGSTAYSAAAKPKQVKKEADYRVRYGMAGCSLGSVIFQNNSKGPQIGASIVNQYLSSTKISNISSTKGSSNCDTGPDRLAINESKVYLDANYASITRDAAQGGGQYLNSFGEILGCSQEAKGELSTLSQKNFGQIFDTDDSNSAYENLKSLMTKDEVLSKECSRLG